MQKVWLPFGHFFVLIIYTTQSFSSFEPPTRSPSDQPAALPVACHPSPVLNGNIGALLYSTPTTSTSFPRVRTDSSVGEVKPRSSPCTANLVTPIVSIEPGAISVSARNTKKPSVGSASGSPTEKTNASPAPNAPRSFETNTNRRLSTSTPITISCSTVSGRNAWPKLASISIDRLTSSFEDFSELRKPCGEQPTKPRSTKKQLNDHHSAAPTTGAPPPGVCRFFI
jgi:hypothetical protein